MRCQFNLQSLTAAITLSRARCSPTTTTGIAHQGEHIRVEVAFPPALPGPLLATRCSHQRE